MEAQGTDGWMMATTFGDLDAKNGEMPDYSINSSKIREVASRTSASCC